MRLWSGILDTLIVRKQDCLNRAVQSMRPSGNIFRRSVGNISTWSDRTILPRWISKKSFAHCVSRIGEPAGFPHPPPQHPQTLSSRLRKGIPLHRKHLSSLRCWTLMRVRIDSRGSVSPPADPSHTLHCSLAPCSDEEVEALASSACSCCSLGEGWGK